MGFDLRSKIQHGKHNLLPNAFPAANAYHLHNAYTTPWYNHHSRASTLLQICFEQSKNCTSLLASDQLNIIRVQARSYKYILNKENCTSLLASDLVNVIRVRARSYKYISNKAKTVRACLQAIW